ncbi:gliding motility-associated C-terminal domain-containing protein [Flavobacterium weaverense]|nr:gliding motility-associated C-terminal domain-containing protein [Flavobacterium weaverense]
MKKNYPFNFTLFSTDRFFYYLFFFSFLANQTYAQVTIGSPNLNFTQICADTAYNTTVPFKVSFTFSPVSALNPGNQFIVEISDATGSFSTPTILVSSSAGAITSSPGNLNFAIPNTTAGEKYKIRVRSTSPAITSPESSSFLAYFLAQNSPFSINNFNASATYCAGGKYVLKIDNPGTGNNDSPMKYPSLTYKWYRDAKPLPLLVGTSPSLEVNQPGIYYVDTNYGSCVSSSYSNRVKVSEGVAGTTVIKSSKGNPFCLGEGFTTLSVDAGNKFQWYLNGNLIKDATAQTYDATIAGLYSCKVDFGGCTTDTSIDLKEFKFTSTINVARVSYLDKGQTQKIVTSTTAISPTYQWFLNDNLIIGASFATFNAITAGDYKVIITQNSSCYYTNEFTFALNESGPVLPPNSTDVVNIPNIISPNGDGINDFWIIPNNYLSGTDTEITVLSSSGKQVLKTNDYQNNWPENGFDFKNINPVFYYIIKTQDNKVKKGSITIIK